MNICLGSLNGCILWYLNAVYTVNNIYHLVGEILYN